MRHSTPKYLKMRVKKVNIFKDNKLEIFNSIETFFIRFTKMLYFTLENEENVVRKRNCCGWPSSPQWRVKQEVHPVSIHIFAVVFLSLIQNTLKIA